VTRGRLPQLAGLPGLNGSGAAAAVPLQDTNDSQPITHFSQPITTSNSSLQCT